MCNVGLVDRIFRGVLGFALIVSALYGFEWGWLGLIPLATAFMGFCPAYTLVGMNTGCKASESQA
ncbi:MAG: hypothetical protein B7Z05_02030 [Thiotrichales bacterium 32-46-8]|jgi:Protein of unknown function (DUF2892).|nr:DUF2892 domain-containing protein [Gammaproteobacteria bacterium]OYX07272.1 MAG: hypothetical protein B7Z05_02030 [Thiotrichales bacterium 32-46-8]OYY22908.1 MAG: hypothetical protein B7Y68_07425 [Thiotrichales bacterium 35-46-9]OYZ07943.1 MAG: hypothetical protein B7Y29_02980 [Thiotrichales bacterium 16-46-22]OZA17474.1 MAG: hypothetical protein B7X85_05065 [Thiotrichales bacterium 17-46-47]OZA95134.1 MAG: hypothetical protein B7X52_07850 [Thiotrichales bacterium 34-46-19]OZB86363.1 MAG: 